jgi:hypothetical protein
MFSNKSAAEIDRDGPPPYLLPEPEFVKHQGAQESIPPAYVALLAGIRPIGLSTCHRPAMGRIVPGLLKVLQIRGLTSPQIV